MLPQCLSVSVNDKKWKEMWANTKTQPHFRTISQTCMVLALFSCTFISFIIPVVSTAKINITFLLFWTVAYELLLQHKSSFRIHLVHIVKENFETAFLLLYDIFIYAAHALTLVLQFFLLTQITQLLLYFTLRLS